MCLIASVYQGIALDPSQEFVFAAGEDRRIRGWSVRSGLALDELAGSGWNPFLFEFPSVVETMQVSIEREGPCLWAGCDRMLYQFHLGQRQ